MTNAMIKSVRRTRFVGSLLALSVLAGCAIGPDYQRPDLDLPEQWQTSAPLTAQVELAQWWRSFNDPVLETLINESLQQNSNLKVAVAAVDAAAAQLQLARADYWPTVDLGVSGTKTRNSEAVTPAGQALNSTVYQAGLKLDYEFDLWGKIRRANEAALAELEANVAARDAVQAALAANVAQAYFQARALDRQIALAEQTLNTRTENVRLQQKRLDSGLISPYDFEQARSEAEAVAAQLPAQKAARAKVQTALAVLRGQSPKAMVAAWQNGAALSADALNAAALPAAPAVPMDLPAQLLSRRPDVRQAEARLQAANARIGVAKAAYLPSLSLTGFAGGVSDALADVLDAPAKAWEVALGLSQPLTSLYRVNANVSSAEAQAQAQTAAYVNTVQTAFKETLDSLSTLTSTREIQQAQQRRVEALSNGYRVAKLRYDAGRIGYLELLDVERQLRQVEQEQVQAQLDQLTATVDLYRALGGGWSQG
ncbi:efflux transporter outer membrane subunit [Permianibacter sp. IMCC34836]|uniref:efflux transporter outer membrane subunit n=1 Tax=Permianibacter fluminis TaxID=2738515 RepID=UPI0015525B1A|nr:efflux transporter outer membrane subunit [Permianibacter fluminis]NQD36689.1 efflux transporter outer membrane subunit [Permianibacter fluminis]